MAQFVRYSPLSIAAAAAVAVAGFAGAACKGSVVGAYDTPPDTASGLGMCAATAPIAVWIYVRDSITGRALADSARGSVRSGVVSDTLIRIDSLVLIGGRQVGIYDVTVDRPRYRTWTASGIAATKLNRCGQVATVAVTARLQPAP